MIARTEEKKSNSMISTFWVKQFLENDFALRTDINWRNWIYGKGKMFAFWKCLASGSQKVIPPVMKTD